MPKMGCIQLPEYSACQTKTGVRIWSYSCVEYGRIAVHVVLHLIIVPVSFLLWKYLFEFRYLYSCQDVFNVRPRLVQAVMLLTCIQYVPRSDLGQDDSCMAFLESSKYKP
jgi:hypothetical protein